MQIKNVRFIIAAITTLSAFAVYVSRVNLSIAIIAMVDDASPGATQTGNAATQTGRALQTANGTRPDDLLEAPHRAPLSTIFPASRKSLLRAPLISQDRFRWDQTAQGHILGAFFYGYIIFQIPGARMAERVGARWILMTATAGSALISLLFPLSTQLNSIHLLMVLRFVMGLCQSAFFPAAYVFFCRWLPESERSVLLPIMFIGSNLGSISTYILSSQLISSSYGWPSVFYASGLVCLLVTLLWTLLGSNGPEDSWLITGEERAYILSKTGRQPSGPTGPAGPPGRWDEPAAAWEAVKLDKLNRLAGPLLPLDGPLAKSKSANDLIPGPAQGQQRQQRQQQQQRQLQLHQLEPGPRTLSWLKVLSSLPIWVLILSMYGNEWSQVVLTYELPTYLNKALKLPIEQNGVINSFFQLSYLIASPIMSSLGACLLERHLFGMRKIHVRKLFQSLATLGQMACFISVPICGPNEGLIIMFMFSAIVLKACANAGDIMVPGDLSPEFAGTIFAFANSIGNTAGVLVPFLAGLIVSDFDQRDNWTPFWLTSAAIMGCSGLIFLLLGETGRQDYAQAAGKGAGRRATRQPGPCNRRFVLD